MKKVLLSLLAVAALVLSCQNYDDEFDALNSKIASLESQITSLAELRTAVTGVQASVSALQTAVSASNTALASSIAAISADLVDLQTAIDSASSAAELTALKTELNTSLAALQALVETNSSSIASLILSNSELKVALEELGVDVDSVLAANASFEGNLTITNKAELAYAKSLGNKVATIKGNVNVLVDASDHTSGGTGEGLTAAEVNPVLSLITYVVGDVKVDSDEELDLSKLQSISGDYVVFNHDAKDDALTSVGDDVYFNYDGAYTSKIETADNIYLVMKPRFAGSATAAAELGTTSVDFTSLTKATGVQSIALNSAHTSGGNVSLSASADTKTIAVAGNSTTIATTNTNATTSIKIGQAQVIGVTGGNNLTSIELHYAADSGSATLGLNPDGVAALPSLTITGTSLTSIKVMAAQIAGSVDINTKALVTSTAAATVDMPNLLTSGTTAGSTFSSDALEHNMAKITRLGSLDLTDDTSVSFAGLAEVNGPITLAKATVFSAPVLVRVAPRRTSAQATAGTLDYDIAGSNITANLVTGSASFPKLTKAGNVVMNSVTSFIAPLAKVSSIDIEEATFSGTLSETVAETVTLPITIELGSVSDFVVAPYSVTMASAFPDAAAITSLKLNAQDVSLTLTSFTNARTITYVGKAHPVTGAANNNVTVSDANVDLTTLVLGGVLGTVLVDTDTAGSAGADASTTVGVGTGTATGGNRNISTALTTISTSGTIVSLTVRDNFDLTTLNALHTDSTTSSTASILVVTNNKNLGTIKSGITTFSNVTITGNLALSSLDLSSVVGLPANFAAGDTVILTVSANYTDRAPAGWTTMYGGAATARPTASTTNPLSTYSGLKGSYQAASAVASEKFIQTGIASLANFFDGLQAKYSTASAQLDTQNVDIDLDYAWQTAAATPAVETFDTGETRNGALTVSGSATSVRSAWDVFQLIQ